MSTDGKKVQKDSMLRNGKAMSPAPIISGIKTFPKAPVRIVVRKKKIITVPCIVAAWRYVPGSRMPRSGEARWARISIASDPPTIAMNSVTK